MSNKNVKKISSDIKKSDPGKPKKIIQFIKINIKSLGVKKFKPDTSVTKRVLNLLDIESTIKKEFVDIIA